jgi:RNA polymerase sigma-70 factor (ECF subfamily)
VADTDSLVAIDSFVGAEVMMSDSSVASSPHANFEPGDSEHGNVEQLLHAAQTGAAEPVGRLLALYRNYLLVLATTQFDRRLRRRVSPSDVVQDALLAAHRDFRQFNGQGERQFLAWLRQILINCLHRAIETHLKTKMRDMRCEISLDQVTTALDRSEMYLGNILAARVASPSEPLRAKEHAVDVANQLAQLRPQYREVIIMRNLQGLSFEEIAERMERNPGAVRMLWLRAIDRLKQTAQGGD